ncbi:hypothetical protein MTX20_13575 [Bradyrhizobium sp. ISRA435]|nr:hypothetical protein MTX20_13575 [Bradyrhizobium sp. ISRA435]
MAAAAGQNREIEQLKTLLFQPEATRLQSLEADLTSLQQYVGSADRLEAATADILVAALERAEVNRPRELANAIAPTVVSAIRSEIRNSRELMVEALYPIVGRLVSAAVANSFRGIGRLARATHQCADLHPALDGDASSRWSRGVRSASSCWPTIRRG